MPVFHIPTARYLLFRRHDVKYRWSSPLLCAALFAGAAASLAAQAPAGAGKKFHPTANLPGGDAVKAFVTARTEKGFVPPKKAWGDPDVSGVFTTKDEANTPFERPNEWAGRKMEDITPREFAEAVAARQQLAVERAPFAGGGEDLVEAGVAIAVPIHWFDNLAAKNSRTWFVIDPVEGKIPAAIPAAEALRYKKPGFLSPERDSYTDRSTTDRCIGGVVWMQPTLYGNSFDIVQTPDHVLFRYEAQRTVRTVRLNQPHIPQTIRPLLGDSIGWFEGNTLVVETTNFPEMVDYRGYSMKDLRLIERFTRIAPNRVEWSLTFDNPKVWPTSWTYSYPMTQDDTQPIFEYACHEGNFGLANILSAGRAAEKATGSSLMQSSSRPLR
ncbi:MAG: hypothetical protein AB7I13_06480 [Vicinamibacterales bacterium]